MEGPNRDRTGPLRPFPGLAEMGKRLRPKSAARPLWLGTVSLLGLALTPTTAVATESPPWEDLPRNTAMVFSINTTEAAWSNLDQFRMAQLLEETFGIAPYPGGLPYLPYGIDYQTYIQPWVGDEAVVALLPTLGGLPGEMDDYSVMIAPITDQTAFEDYFQLLVDSQASPPTRETFRQTEILFWPNDLDSLPEGVPEDPMGGLKSLRLSQMVGLPLSVTAPKALPEGDRTFDLDIPLPIPQPTSSGLAVALLPDTLIAAENPQAIKTFLRYRRGGQGRLSHKPQFQRTLAHPQRAKALLTVYGNPLELLNFSAPDLPLPPIDLPIQGENAPTSLSTLRALNFGGTLEVLVYPTNRGIQLQGRYYYDATPFTFGLTEFSPQADTVLEQLPASTYLLMSGRDLAGLWQQFTNIVNLLGPDLADGLETVREGFTLLTGLDLDRDLFGWMDGEIAFAAFPAEDTPFQMLVPQLQMGIGLLLQTSDRATATHTLATADELFTTLGFGVQAETVNNEPISSWNLWSGWDSAPDAPRQSILSHGWVTENTLAVVSGPGTMARVMNPTPNDPLRSFPLFQNAVAPFPGQNNGYFYVNMGATLSLIYQAFDLHDVPEFQPFKPFLGSVSTLSATSTQTSDFIEIRGQLGLAPRIEN
jgi:hypothetical protein